MESMRVLFLLLFLAIPACSQILRCGDVGCLTNPMTNAGDIIVGGALGVPARLAASSGYLHWNGSAFVYDTPGGGGGTPGGVNNDLQINSSGVFGAVHPTAAGFAYWNGSAWSVANIPTGGSGALDCTLTGSACDIVTSVVPLKATAQTIPAYWSFRGASATAPNRAGTGSPNARDNCAATGETYFQTNATAGSNSWACTTTGTPGTWTLQGSAAGAVSSFTGDGTLISNSASTGAVTATLATAAAHSYFGNNTGSTAAPGYHVPLLQREDYLPTTGYSAIGGAPVAGTGFAVISPNAAFTPDSSGSGTGSARIQMDNSGTATAFYHGSLPSNLSGTWDIKLDFYADNASQAYTLQVRTYCIAANTPVIGTPTWNSFVSVSGTASSTVLGRTTSTHSNVGCTAGQDFDLEVDRTDTTTGNVYVRGIVLVYKQSLI